MKTGSWQQRIQDPRRLHALRIRSQVEAGVRRFFEARGFLETRTPILVPCPGMEPHIRPFSLSEGYLHTSPEFAMKRLLVGGLQRIFQLAPVFRKEPHSPHHLPEFTMLEWYRAHATEEAILKDTETLVESLACEILGKPELTFQGKPISVKAPWPRHTMQALFRQHLSIDLADPESLAPTCLRLGLVSSQAPLPEWDDLFFLLWLNVIEPQLPADQAVFVTRYPASQAALAVLTQEEGGVSWAKRFEVYAGGLELGNAFEELTDSQEQRRRFIADMKLRERTYGSDFPTTPLDEGFLQALEEGMPPSAGIAMGLDRLVMLLADELDIHFTVWLDGQVL